MMVSAAHNHKMARKMGVPVKAAKKYNRADKGTGILRKKRGR